MSATARASPEHHRPLRNGVGVAALVFGVVSLVLALLILFFPLAALLGLVAIILGIVGLSRASRGEASNRGQALAGLITGLLGVALAVFFTISIGVFFAEHQNDFRQFGNCMLNADNESQRRQCIEDLGGRLEAR